MVIVHKKTGKIVNIFDKKICYTRNGIWFERIVGTSGRIYSVREVDAIEEKKQPQLNQ